MEYKIPNRLECIYDLEGDLLSQIEDAGYDENSRFAIRLALDEALINAFKHGNQEDPNKAVRIRCEISVEEVVFEIEDEGNGFVRESVIDPRQAECLHRTSGRGIFLIEQFMTHLHFNEKGNRIQFSYQRKPELGINAHGLAHWKFESAEVLELDPIRSEKSPSIIFDSVLGLIEKGTRRVILDLKFLQHLTPPMVTSVVQAAIAMREKGGRMIAIRPHPDVERVLANSCNPSTLGVFGDLKSGLESLELDPVQ